MAGLLEREMGHVQFVSVHGYLPAALDYQCVAGEEGGPINYRGTMAGICVPRREAYLMY